MYGQNTTKERTSQVPPYHIYELRELETQLDGEPVRIVADRSNQAVVIGQQVLVETLGVLIAGARCYQMDQHKADQKPQAAPTSRQFLAIRWPICINSYRSSYTKLIALFNR